MRLLKCVTLVLRAVRSVTHPQSLIVLDVLLDGFTITETCASKNALLDIGMTIRLNSCHFASYVTTDVNNAKMARIQNVHNALQIISFTTLHVMKHVLLNISEMKAIQVIMYVLSARMDAKHVGLPPLVLALPVLMGFILARILYARNVTLPVLSVALTGQVIALNVLLDIIFRLLVLLV